MGAVFRPVVQPEPAGGREGRDLGGGLGAGTQPALLSAAPQERREFKSAADILNADALGGADLMPAHGEQVHAQFLHGKGDF